MSPPSSTPDSVSAYPWAQAVLQWPSGFALLDANGIILQANPALASLLGLHGMSLAGRPFWDLLSTESRDASALGVLKSSRRHSFELEVRLVTQGLPERWVQLSAQWVAEAGPVEFMVQVQDIDTRKQAEALQGELVASLHAMSGELRRELRHLGAHDALTGLPNRASFELQLVAITGRVREGERSHSLVFLDLDRFKIINDTAGHDVGDALLRQVADRLRRQMAPGSILARLGGDEFALLLQCGLEAAEAWVGEVLRDLAAEPFVWRGRRYDVGASAGVAPVVAETESVAELMGQADVACYAAKAAGRNRVCTYHADAVETLERHRELRVVSALRQTLESNRCVLHAQRIVATDHRAEQRFEVLVRMLDDDGQLLPPTSFIPAAEHYDLMMIVDRWVFETVLLRHGPELARLPQLVLHLNVSANSLNDPGFLAATMSLLQASPVPAQRIVFEITETALIGNLTQAAQVIRSLRDLGCGVALDDFGIGLSSFNYLRTFPVDFVKIDGSFIRRMPQSLVDRRIVRSIHDIAQVLGATTIAESVESAEVFEMVRSTGIHFAQGFGLHRPESMPELLERLWRRRSQAALPDDAAKDRLG